MTNLSAPLRAKLSELAKNDTPLFDACVKNFHVDDLLSFTVDCALSWMNPHNIELLKNNDYKAVIEKYKK